MKSFSLSLCLGLVAMAASQVDAGCGLLRRGGCSDPCAAAAYGGYGVSSCSSCSAASQYVSAAPAQAGCASCGVSSGLVTNSGGCASCGAASMLTNGGAYVGGAVMSAPASSGCAGCGSAMAPAASMSYSAPMQAIVPTQQSELLDCGPVQSYKVVMEPEYFTETKYVPTTEYQDEIRYRTRSIARQVPVQVEDYRTTTVMVPKTETKTINYSVLVPQKQEKTVELVETVPVWNEIVENYTVRVPTLIDVPESYTVKVAQLRDEQFTYTVYVPQAQTQTKMQSVTNAVPVVRTRTIEVSRPVTRMQTVSKDYGHWEMRVEEVAAPSVSYAAPAVTYSAPAYTAPMYSAPSMGISTGGCSTYSGSCGACGGSGQSYTTLRRGCRLRSKCGSCGGCGIASRCGGCGSGSCGGGCASASMSNCGGACGSSGCGGSCGVSSGMTAYSTISAAPAYSSAGCATESYSAPTTQTISRRVWVPNVVTEEVAVTENVSDTQVVTYTAFEQETQQVPYECTFMVYAPEQRSGTKKVVDYVEQERTRTRKVVQYNEETRTRTRKELSYKQESRTQTVPYVTYTTEQRTKEVSYTINVPTTNVEPITRTRYDTVNEEITEEYSVRVPVASSKEVQVQSCRMVPRLVPVTIYPCSSVGSELNMGANAVGGAFMGQSADGCVNCGNAPTLAPVMSSGCAGCAAAQTPCTACQGM